MRLKESNNPLDPTPALILPLRGRKLWGKATYLMKIILFLLVYGEGAIFVRFSEKAEILICCCPCLLE